MMVRWKRKAKDSMYDKNYEDDLPAETTGAEIDVSNSVMVSVAENNILSQSGYEVENIMEEVEKEKNATLVGGNEVNQNKTRATEEENVYEEHAAEEVETGQGEAEEEGKEEDHGDCDDDNNGGDVDDDDFDDDDDDNDFNEGDEYDDYDVEKDEMMEKKEIDEKEKVENNDNIVEKSYDDSERNTMEEGQEEDVQGDAMEQEGEKNAKEDFEEQEGRSKQKVKKLRKGSRKKDAAGGCEKVASKRDDKLESSQRKKSSEKFESMGMIFMCSSKTKRDCYHYKVLGLPANKRDVVGKIYKGMRLFLYDVDLKLMYGIYKAAGPGGYNIQPKAFNSQFPSQVRFTILKDCLPLAEEKFKKVIKDNYFTRAKFDCLLTSQQVKNLCKLFVAASKGSKSKRLAGRVMTRASTDQDRFRVWGEERRFAMYEKRRYHDYSHQRKREVVASQEAPMARFLLPPSYAYDRTLDMDAYRRDLLVEHLDTHRHPVLEPLDAYRRDPLTDHLNSYRRDVAMQHRDMISREEIGRGDPYISYRERPEYRDLPSRDDFGRHDPYFSYRGSSEDHNLRYRDQMERHDPYISYRERPAYRDHVYGTGLLPEYDHYRPISQAREYRSTVGPQPNYYSARPPHQY